MMGFQTKTEHPPQEDHSVVSFKSYGIQDAHFMLHRMQSATNSSTSSSTLAPRCPTETGVLTDISSDC